MDSPTALAFRLNGEPSTAPAGTTVADVVARLVPGGPPAEGIAVAVDDEVVPRGRWAQHELAPGARVEVLTAVAGG